MKITIYELLGMIKDGEAPKKIKWKNNIYTYVYDDDREENIINYYCDLERHIHLIDGRQHDIRLNDEVEIIEEEKKIPEKLSTWYSVEVTQSDEENVEYENYNFKTMYEKINEICDYFKSKGE